MGDNMSDPTFEPLHTGNTGDDDWQVFDDYLQQSPLPPEPPADTPIVNKEAKPPSLTRIVSNTYNFANAGPTAPVVFQCAWPDPNRQELHLRVFSSTGTDSAQFADSKDGQQISVNALDLDVRLCHAGALWATVTNPAVTIQVWSVTK